VRCHHRMEDVGHRQFERALRASIGRQHGRRATREPPHPERNRWGYPPTAAKADFAFPEQARFASLAGRRIERHRPAAEVDVCSAAALTLAAPQLQSQHKRPHLAVFVVPRVSTALIGEVTIFSIPAGNTRRRVTRAPPHGGLIALKSQAALQRSWVGRSAGDGRGNAEVPSLPNEHTHAKSSPDLANEPASRYLPSCKHLQLEHVVAW